MAVCHFPSFFTPPHNCNCPHLKWGAHHYPLNKNLLFACSAEKSRKKGKASKPTKSNEDLCNELREFISVVGLPENHVPSMKELSENGRKDLANIVRRRGYKVIAEILRTSFKNYSDTEKPPVDDENFSNACSYDASASPVLSLQSRAANFVQTGKLDILEEAFEIESGEMPTDSEHESVNISSDDLDDTDDIVHVDFQNVPILPQQTDRNQVISNQGSKAPDDDGDLTSEKAGERINQAEINRLKVLLHQKEMELLELKRQIEKEKQSLYILQDKADEEIGDAHRMTTEKHMEVRAAEESLSGLKEVLIEYWANGETIEVAGSFNGWHNRIKMDMHPSSELVDPPCSRGSKLWSTILWLYPGIYEIKFIVDGTWKVDPNREMVTTFNITNNILRVDI